MSETYFTTMLAEPDVAGLAAPGIGPRQRLLAWSAMAALVGIGAAVTPFAGMALLVIPSGYALFGAAMFIVNLILAALLFIKGHIEGRGDSVRLGAAYWYVCLMTIPQTASFPGGLMPAPLIGAGQTPLWLWCFWHMGFALATLRYAWFARRPVPPRSSLPISLAVAAVAAAGVTAIASACTAYLPLLLVDAHFVLTGTALGVWLTVACLMVAALAAVLPLRRSPEQLWLAVAVTASCLEIWLNLYGASRYTLGWYLAKAAGMLGSVTVLVALLYEITCLYRDTSIHSEKLEVLARRDALTGLANRRSFDEVLDLEFRRARRQQLPLAVVFLDIDNFKAYNDRYGHRAGDDCLRRIAAAVMAALWRPGDHAARYGGEEMAIVLPGTEIVGGVLIAERVRAAVVALQIANAGSGFGVVSVSVGVAAVTPGRGDQTATDLVDAADRALYQAKRNGRNRVNVAGMALDAGATVPSLANGQ